MEIVERRMEFWVVSSNRRQFVRPLKLDPVFVAKILAIRCYWMPMLGNVNWLVLLRGLCYALVDVPISQFEWK